MFQEILQGGGGGGSTEPTFEYYKKGTNSATPTNYATLQKGKYIAVTSSTQGGKNPTALDTRTTPTVKSGTATITKIEEPIYTNIGNGSNIFMALMGLLEIVVNSDVAEIYNPQYANMVIISK